MDTATTPMDIDEDFLSDTDTCYYDDQDIDLSDDEINEINWRYVFQETINNIRDNRLDDGAKPLPVRDQCKIRIRKLGDTPFTFPLSNALCSRIICEHGKPLSLSNKYEFCGIQVTNSAWQIDRTAIDFPLSFSAAIRTSTMEQLHLTSPDITTHFDLQLHQLLMFGPCSQPKLYTFDDQLFVYHATVLVFLPSSHTGGHYRFIDDNDDENNARRHVFKSNQWNNSKPFILVIPSDCQHEISGIEKGFQLLLVYHLITKTNSINQLYSLLSNPIDQIMTMEKIFLIQRLRRVLTYWKNHPIRSPNKLLIPLQHPLDYSSYFSLLFRDRYRLALQLLISAVQSSFLIYSAVIQRDEPSGTTSDSRFVLHSLHLLNTIDEFTLNFPLRHERTFLPHEFLGDLQVYNDTFEQGSHHPETLANGKQILRNDLKYHVLAIIPYESQWDLLLDDPSFAYHHLSYMLSQSSNHYFDRFSLNFLECFLRDRITSNYSFDKLITYLIRLRHRFGLTTKVIELLQLLLDNKSFKEQVFLKRDLDQSINQLVDSFHSSSKFSVDFLDLFRQILCSAMPTKLHEIVQFLLQFTHRTLRALLINNLIRFIFRIRALPRHVLFSTLCSILHLLIVDGSYSIDSLLILAYQIIKRVRKTSSDNEIIDKYLKIHLIPTLIHIYRQTKTQSISPAFLLLYEYCFNTLNSYCSLPVTSSSPLNIISINESHLMCPCSSCMKLQEFLLDSKHSTLIQDLSTSDHCLRHTLSKFPMLSIEYKHDPCTGDEQTLIISKCGYEEDQKQLCFHLRRLLGQFHRM